MALRRTRVVAPSWRAAGDEDHQPGRQAAGAEAAGWEPAASTGAGGLGTRLQAALSRSFAVALWSVLVLALVLGMVNCARIGAPGAAGVVEAPPTAPVPPPGGCAELAVAAWVAGEAQLLGAGGQPGDDAPVREAVRTYTAAVTPAETPDSWGYLVGARLRERDEEGAWRDAGLHFFSVTMVQTGLGCQGWSPAALPMQVPAPALAVAAPDRYPVTLSTSGTALADTLQAFFSGVLAGAGGVDRYVAPGATIPPVQPPPYPAVQLEDVRAAAGTPAGRSGEVPAEGTAARLLVTVSAEGAVLPLAYPVTVAVRGGRWEVLAIDPLVGAEPWQAASPTPVTDPGRETP